tara:strand:+ start:533 stop:1015 length:483 start_codon:yes stop_codon:yes gene_type:complete
MNNIEVVGGSITQKKYIKSMAEYCCEMLMPRMKSLDIEIHVKDFKKDDNYGYAWPVEDSLNPRSFELEINKHKRLRRVLETVAHEMVHVKQFARNELYEPSAKQGSRWRGEWFSPRQKCVKDYWDQPWEIEAHGRECGLFVRWAEKNGYSKKKWAQYDLV